MVNWQETTAQQLAELALMRTALSEQAEYVRIRLNAQVQNESADRDALLANLLKILQAYMKVVDMEQSLIRRQDEATRHHAEVPERLAEEDWQMLERALVRRRSLVAAAGEIAGLDNAD